MRQTEGIDQQSHRGICWPVYPQIQVHAKPWLLCTPLHELPPVPALPCLVGKGQVLRQAPRPPCLPSPSSPHLWVMPAPPLLCSLGFFPSLLLGAHMRLLYSSLFSFTSTSQDQPSACLAPHRHSVNICGNQHT